ncbi:hypothetical protein [Lysinibacillus xylanilyticus]|uniref:hypothetical protein n=1 Tax=Lysinibacillus xylanilyticus TaxID=582475 RepID=UPI003D0091F2
MATKKASKAVASIVQKSKYINLENSCPAPKTYSVHDGEPKTTLTDLRKVLSTPSTVYPDGLAPFTVMGANLAYALLLEDIATYANPNATAGERNGAALSLLNPIGKAGKVKKGAEAFKDMGKGIEAAHDLANNANKVQKTQHTQKEIEQLGEYSKKQLDKGTGDDLLSSNGKFKDSKLESDYQKYLARKAKGDKPPRGRSEWKKTRDYWLNDSPVARGNAFNKKSVVEEWYPCNEVHLSNGKRLDSYDPIKGEIVSRKATDLGNIELSTFESYLKEMKVKYEPGTIIRTDKYADFIPPIDGQPLKGKQILEIPASNKNFSGIQEYIDLAKNKYGIEIRFREE